MPIFSRRQLRQSLGQRYLRDTVVGQTSGSWGTQAGSANIVDLAQADYTASGEQLYQRHYMRLLGSAGLIQDLRVASFNTGSGAFVAAQTLATTIFSGMPFEVHVNDPKEKDRALDDVIRQVRVRREVPLWATDGLHVYSLGPDVFDVVGVRFFSDPASSLNRGEAGVSWWKYETTQTGNELRISPSLLASYQLAIDAVLAVSLGAGDLATVNLPDEDWILSGAGARLLWLLEQRSPGQENGVYKERRKELAREYTRLSARFQPRASRRLMLDEVW